MAVAPPPPPEPQIGPPRPEMPAAIPRLHLSKAVLFSLGSLGIGMVFTFFSAAMPLFLNSYDLPNTLIGALSNERSFASAVVLPLVGVWSDRTRTRFGKRRPFLLISAPLVALTLIVLGLHPPFWLMIILVLLVAIFLYAAVGPYQTMMADIAPPNQRGELGSYMALAGMIGAVLVNVVAGIFWEESQMLVFGVTAVGLMAGLLATFYFVGEPEHHFHPVTPVPREAGARFQPRRYAGEVLSHTQSMRYIVALCFFQLAQGGATPFLTLFGTETLQVSEGQAFWLFLVVVISTAAGTLPVGWLARRYGTKVVLQGGLAVFTIAALGGVLVQDVWQAVPVMILVGLGNAAPTALIVAVLSELMPQARGGEFIGIAAGVWSLVQPFGGFIAGWLVDTNGGNIRWAFGFAAIMMAITLAALFVVRMETRTDE